MTSDVINQQGEAVDRGEFRLDERRARQKLRDYRLPSPHHYILEFVKAARLLDAGFVKVQVERDRVEVKFDGDNLSHQQLLELYSAAFSSSTDRRRLALRHLAMGVNAAHGAGLRRLLIASGGEQSGAVEIGEDSIHPAKFADDLASGTHIRLEKRFHQAVLTRFIDKLSGDYKETKLLRKRARYCEIPVVVNGTNVSRRLTPGDEVRAVQRYEEPGEQGAVGLMFNDTSFITRLVQHGVLIDDDVRRSPLEPLGIRAVVESQQVDTDLAQSSIVRNGAWAALHLRVVAEGYRSLLTLLNELSDDEVRARADTLRQMTVHLLAQRQHRGKPPRTWMQLVEALTRLPVFERAIPESFDERYISIHRATRVVDDHKTVRWSRRRFGAWFGEAPEQPALWLNPDDPAFAVYDDIRQRHRFLELIAHGRGDSVVDVTEQLEKLNRRDDNRRRWQRRPSFTTKARGIRTATVKDLTVQVGLAFIGDANHVVDKSEASKKDLEQWRDAILDEAGWTKVFFVKDDRLIADASFSSAVEPLRIVIGGNLPVNKAFDGPDYKATKFRAAVDEALRLVGEQLEEQSFSLDVFCALMGDFQQQLNRVFHRDWPDWSPQVRQTPLGIAPALNAETTEEAPKSLARRRINRLGALADREILESVEGTGYSLRDLFELLYGPPDPGCLVQISGGFAVQSPPGNRTDEIRFLVLAPERLLIEEFFEHQSRHREETGESSNDGDKTDGLGVGDKRPWKDTAELLSRIVREESGAGRREEGDEEPEQLPSTPAQQAERGESVAVRLLADLRSHAPTEVAPRLRRVEDVEVIDRCGSVPVHVLGDGNHLVFDAAHPAVRTAVDHPDDPVALGFAAGAAFGELLNYDVDHGRASWSRPKILVLRRRFLQSLTGQFHESDETK